MRTLDPSIALQKEIGDQIYNALQGDILMQVREICEGNGHIIFAKSRNEGNSLKILPTTLPDLYQTCMEVKETLGYQDDVDFYVSGDSEMNAYSQLSMTQETPDMIVLNSALVKLFTIDELKYVVGHEIGHLINRDTIIRSLLHFVYDGHDRLPLYIGTRANLYDHLAELSADRYGYAACEDLNACVTACYKLASGLDLQGLNVSVKGLIADANERVEKFFDGTLDIYGNDHPVIPMRVFALNLYATAKTKKALEEGMYKIYNFTYGRTEEDHFFGRFAAAAGIILGKVDGKLSDSEKALIYERIGEGDIFVKSVMREVEKEGVEKVFQEAVSVLLDHYPETRRRMVDFYCDLALADNELTAEEVNHIFAFGKMIDVPEDVLAEVLRDKIRDDYVPKTL